MRRFEGRTALVTGGARGIGLAVAHRLADEGAAVAIADLDGGAAEHAASELTGSGGVARGWAADVSDDTEVRRLGIEVVRDLGPVDVLFSAAGVLAPDLAGTEHDTAVWDRTMSVNLRGQLLVARAVVPGMRERGRGAIVLVSSSSALIAEEGSASYSVSKAGVIMLSKQLAVENAAYGIRCNCICPGWINTTFNDPVIDSSETHLDVVERTVPMRREGTADEVAAGAAFLCSDEASYMTGAVVVIDGGLSLGVDT